MATSLASCMIIQHLTTCTACLIVAFMRSWALRPHSRHPLRRPSPHVHPSPLPRLREPPPLSRTRTDRYLRHHHRMRHCCYRYRQSIQRRRHGKSTSQRLIPPPQNGCHETQPSLGHHVRHRTICDDGDVPSSTPPPDVQQSPTPLRLLLPPPSFRNRPRCARSPQRGVMANSRCIMSRSRTPCDPPSPFSPTSRCSCQPTKRRSSSALPALANPRSLSCC